MSNHLQILNIQKWFIFFFGFYGSFEYFEHDRKFMMLAVFIALSVLVTSSWVRRDEEIRNSVVNLFSESHNGINLFDFEVWPNVSQLRTTGGKSSQ